MGCYESIKAGLEARDSLYVMACVGRDRTDGLLPGKLYSAVCCVEVAGTKLIQVRDPWPRSAYTGPWAEENAANWTSEVS